MRYIHGAVVGLLVAVSMLTCGLGLAQEVVIPEGKVVRGFTEGPAMNAIKPGEFFIDPPTIENLGFRWYVEGDSNLNASVEVAFREKGQAEWKPALPMLRVHHEIPHIKDKAWRTGNLFAGSVLLLKAATEYEVRFTMTDPDGGAQEPKVVSVATRSAPVAFEGGRKLHVFPADYQGVIDFKGAFRTPAEAAAVAQPGDIVLLHAGTHKQTATWQVGKSGQPGKPIVFRGAGDGEAIIEGPDYDTDLININGCDWLTFEKLTLRKTKRAIQAGIKDARGEAGAKWLVVQRCKLEDVWVGIWTYSDNSENWYIADNVVTGRNLTSKRPNSKEEQARDILSHTGICVNGRGHVICHNRVSRFWDCMAKANNPYPLEDLNKQVVAVDVHNNDLFAAQDDNIETDYSAHNYRVYNNRCRDALMGISSQPCYGGPLYIVRNVVYGIRSNGMKLNCQPAGLLIYNNTFIYANTFGYNSVWNVHLRNNLLLGRPGAEAKGLTGQMATYTPGRTTSDYNGYSFDFPAKQLAWGAGSRTYKVSSLADLAKATGQELHGVIVGYDIFVNASPNVPTMDWDLQLKAGSAATDKGVALPTITDGFMGAAPDLGCYEFGKPLPHYGPRPE